MSIVESLATRLYGWGPDEAREAGVCIRCHQPIGYNDLEPVDRREYDLSALCGGCFDAIMGDDDDNVAT